MLLLQTDDSTQSHARGHGEVTPWLAPRSTDGISVDDGFITLSSVCSFGVLLKQHPPSWLPSLDGHYAASSLLRSL